MAFTVSHAVLAPLLHKLSYHSLPIAALAIGCMAPDLYRLFTSENSNTTHQWNSILTHTLWLGLGFCVVWYALYRPVLYRFLGLQDPITLNNLKGGFVFINMTVVALILGICTHLIWDGLTHADFRTFIFHDFLAQNVMLFGQQFPLHRVLQIGSSFLALPFILWASWHYYQQHRQHVAVPQAIRIWAAVILGLSLLIASFSALDYLRHIPEAYFAMGLYHITGKTINEFSQGFLITFSLGCLLFLFFDRDQRLG